MNRGDESFLIWVSMDADVFAQGLIDSGDPFTRFTYDQCKLAWERAMEYVVEDPDINGAATKIEAHIPMMRNFFAYYLGTGMLVGALYADMGDLKPKPK